MKKISTLLIDVGGVLLTNGWDRESRTLAAETFGLDLAEMNERHSLTFDTYELGKISLEEYLNRVVFYKKRKFTQEEFQKFMMSRSKPFPEMIELIRTLKEKYKLKVGVLSNEGRELTEYRVKKFKLNGFVDFFVSSCFVHLKKPDPQIYQMAVDLSQTPQNKILYIDDRVFFVEIAEKLGLQSLHHVDYPTTVSKLQRFI